MAAKPATVPLWDTNATNSTAPSADHRSDGWEDDEVPPAAVFNHEQNLYGAWAAYLNDGQFTGNHEIDGALEVTGAVGVDGLVTARAGMTCAANQHVTVSGTGDVKHGDRVLCMTPVAGHFEGSTSWDYPNPFAAASAAGAIYVPLPLRVGDRVKRLTGRIWGNGVTKITVRIVVYDGSGAAAASGGGVTEQVPAAAWTTSNTTDPALSHTLAAGESAVAVVEFDGAGRIQTLNVTYDHP
jgi:hypothetical protein